MSSTFESDRLSGCWLVVIVVADPPHAALVSFSDASPPRQWATSSASRSRACAQPAPP